MEYWFNRPESEQDADLEEVTRHELYGYDRYQAAVEDFPEEEYDGRPAPLGSLATPREAEENAVDPDEVRRLRRWSEEHQL